MQSVDLATYWVSWECHKRCNGEYLFHHTRFLELPPPGLGLFFQRCNGALAHYGDQNRPIVRLPPFDGGMDLIALRLA